MMNIPSYPRIGPIFFAEFDFQYTRVGPREDRVPGQVSDTRECTPAYNQLQYLDRLHAIR
jgi:hypothetical protein